MVGTDAHDRLYLDANGNIQYLNLQSGGGTPDDYSFVLDEDGHNQRLNRYIGDMLIYSTLMMSI